MKRFNFQLAIILLVFILLGCKKPIMYKDGTYFGKSKAIYSDENFWGSVEVIIEKNEIVDVNFRIIDSTNQEIFDHTYEKHYLGNDLYIQQCRDDWQGVLYYPEKLIKSQNIEEVDVISGATWSYNIFRYAIMEALKNAQITESEK